MSRTGENTRASHAPGLLLRAAGFYDFTLWLFMLGRERSFREQILRAADLAPGQDVLDVGCGTGSLAMFAKRAVGPQGRVYGIDASPHMLKRAYSKSRRSGMAVEFREAPAQALPFPDARFDVVLNTLMLHHLPRPSRERCVAEMKRVLKPGGRLIVVDFEAPAARHPFSIHRHGAVRSRDIVDMLVDSGLTILRSEGLGFRNMHLVSAAAG